MKLKPICFLCIVLFISCNHTDKKAVAKANTKPTIAKSVQSRFLSENDFVNLFDPNP
jgi:hypothetical protein